MVQQHSNLKTASLVSKNSKIGVSSTPLSQPLLHHSSHQIPRSNYESQSAPSHHQEQQAHYRYFCKYDGKTQPTPHHHHHFSQQHGSSRLASLEHEREQSSHHGKSSQQRSASSSAILANTTTSSRVSSHFSKSHSMMITPHRNFGNNSEEQISLPPPIPPLPINYQRSDGKFVKDWIRWKTIFAW